MTLDFEWRDEKSLADPLVTEMLLSQPLDFGLAPHQDLVHVEWRPVVRSEPRVVADHRGEISSGTPRVVI